MQRPTPLFVFHSSRGGRTRFHVVGEAYRRRLMMVAVVVLAAFVSAFAAPVQVQGQAAEEHEVKAAFLYNFTKFVEWPRGAFRDDGAPVVVGVFGPDPFGAALDEIVAGKVAGERPFVIRRLDSSDGLAECHVLFVSSAKAAEFVRLLPSLAHRPILTLGETDRFCESGGVVQFVMRQRKVRFRINVTAAERAGLKISSRLLDLAEVVRQSP